MKTTNILLASGMLFALGMVPASAEGPCRDQIDQVAKLIAAKDAGSGPTTGTPEPMASDQKGQHPGTSLMTKEAEGKATSPEDVRKQTGALVDVSAALKQARTFDQQGKETECLETVKHVKQLAGV